MDQRYLQKKLYMIGALLLVIGGLNWGIVALTGGDLVSSIFGRGSVIARGIFFLVALAAVGVVFKRDYYLPFLGEAHVPCSVLADKAPEGADTSIGVRVQPGAKVVYWAAEPANDDLTETNDYRGAYLEYRNAGVVTADQDGNATLRVRTPQGYTVPVKGQLPPHIHYRECAPRGFMKSIVTVTLDGKEYFSNPVSREEEPEKIRTASDFAYVTPSTALAEINYTARATAEDSLMPESGALVEWTAEGSSGSDLDAAFGPLMQSDLPTLTGSTPTGDVLPQRT
jgi:uncharacterized membrane protein YuzA (DUF378 family)